MGRGEASLALHIWGQKIRCFVGEHSCEAVLGTGELARIWVTVQTPGREYYEDHLATAGVRTEPQDSAAFRVADSVLQEAHVGRVQAGRRSLHLWGSGGCPQPQGGLTG